MKKYVLSILITSSLFFVNNFSCAHNNDDHKKVPLFYQYNYARKTYTFTKKGALAGTALFALIGGGIGFYIDMLARDGIIPALAIDPGFFIGLGLSSTIIPGYRFKNRTYAAKKAIARGLIREYQDDPIIHWKKEINEDILEDLLSRMTNIERKIVTGEEQTKIFYLSRLNYLNEMERKYQKALNLLKDAQGLEHQNLEFDAAGFIINNDQESGKIQEFIEQYNETKRGHDNAEKSYSIALKKYRKWLS